MRRPRRLLSPACLAVLVASLAPFWVGALPATADPTDGTITVVVVRDADGDAHYDPATDPPQSGVGITVTDASGKSEHATTDASGEAVVGPSTELTGGRYFVTAEVPDELGLVPVPESESFAAPSSTVDVTAESRTVRLAVAAPTPAELTSPAPEPPPSEPAAAVPDPVPPAAPRFAVGDRVWRDLDRQGRQDEGEPAASRTSVQLLDADGNVLDSTRTDSLGRYRFDDLPAGRYAVRFAGIPAGSQLSPARTTTGSSASALDSDPDYTGVTPPFTLDVGQPDVRRAVKDDGVRADYINSSVDAGVATLTYAVGSVVWRDANGDGVLDPAEPPGQAKVSLLDGRGNQLAVVRTDDQGRFLFADLAAGTYQLRFDDLGAHRQLTRARVGGSLATSSAADPATGTTKPFDLKQGAPDLIPAADFGGADADLVKASLNVGTVGSYSITNRVWRDSDGDGLLGDGEPGVAGVRVELLDAHGAVVATTTTGKNGRYSFDRLTAGAYQLRFSRLPAGLFFTAPGVGADRALDSDVYGNAVTAPITVGEDHPVEAQVAAGLTTSAAAAAGTVAPAVVAGAPAVDPPVAADPHTDAIGWVALGVGVLLTATLVGYLRVRTRAPRPPAA